MEWSRLPPLAALRAFEAAARCRSFTRAAQELNVTHAAIAQHVRKLETALAHSLVVRDGRGIAVTPAGVHLAEALTLGFGTIGAAVDRLQADAETRPLSLSVTPAFAAGWLMPRIGDFWTRHPDIPLNIQPNVEVSDLRRDGVDMAIRHGDGIWPGLDAELLTDGDHWVVVHPDLLGECQPSCLGDLLHLPWLLEHYMLERRAMIEREGIDLDDVRMQLMETNWMVLAAAQAGHGVTVQPKSLVDRDVAAGTLVKVCELNGGSLGYYLVTLPGRVSPRLRTLRRWLHGQVGNR
ncbi:MAG: LysR family transcriptional regulator [Jannaschia helgolandensis]|uniref:LysR family transcriptional regulator, glycine cleavage system transcriptional activator n=1 Tax=Jannaschia helgolandensis TaxID=188906 RepID=A0A1H7IP01_9RHOB|nr:LysR family transcriptional regulator [Jannaschia helgolandensis]SEK64223.1 LysR family transcriptional regulator, glycine cleavage system transcriptional activator [Jannaschia helgolandensis]